MSELPIPPNCNLFVRDEDGVWLFKVDLPFSELLILPLRRQVSDEEATIIAAVAEVAWTELAEYWGGLSEGEHDRIAECEQNARACREWREKT